jgi:preprotein translocase subunit SecG
MTLRTNARIAGITFLLYIVTGITGMILFHQASGGDTTAARLASIASHATLVRCTTLLTMLEFVYALVLATTIFALTRDIDRDLALLAAACRFAEGVLAAMSADQRLELLSIATASTTATGADAAATIAQGNLMFAGSVLVPSLCFVCGSTIYSFLFLRGRNIPAAIAWNGVFASLLLLVALPVQIAGFLPGGAAMLIWIPMALFEVVFGVWLIARGVTAPMPRPSPVTVG